jgi:RNA polymerase sigma-70 factor (ECF subfamily)
VAATGSAAEAEDAAQDAFITAFRGLGRFRGESSFKTWLLTIAWNKALDRRRASRRWIPLDTPGLAVEPAVNNPAPDAELAARGARDAARLLIARLPFKLRDPLLLTARGEHSYEEISTMLGIPVGTLKWRVSEARRIVKEKLRRMGY